MSSIWSAAKAAEATNGKIASNWVAGKIVFDSRLVEKDDLFIALPGANTDGHLFVNNAFKKGAAAAIVSKTELVESQYKDKLLIVENVQQALIDLANYKKKQSKSLFIAVTGSVGKTSTKEILYHCLSAYAQTFASRANYNNILGLNINLASVPDDTKYSVFELGMDKAGEIKPMSLVLKPDIAVITAIEPVHQAQFNSLEDIAIAKSEILCGLKEQGMFFYNSASNCVSTLLNQAEIHHIKNSLDFNKTSKIINYQVIDNLTISEVEIWKQKHKLVLETIISIHQIYNIVNALVIIAKLGLSLEPAIEKLKSFKLPAGRGEIVKIQPQVILIDDSYNASPASIKAALQNMLNFKGRKIALLGDMKELGNKSVELHIALKNHIEQYDIDLVLTYGDEMKNLFKALPEYRKYKHFNDLLELESELISILRAGDILLIKGSNSTKLHLISQNLRKSHAI